DVYIAAYWYFTSYPSTDEFFTWVNAGSFVPHLQLLLTGTGLISVEGGSFNTLFTTNNAIPLNQWVRIEARVTIGTTTSNGAVELRVYLGDSSTPLEVRTATGVNTNTVLPTEVWFQAPGVACYLDDVGISDEGWLTPPVEDVTVAGSDAATVTDTAAGVEVSITESATLLAAPTITGDPTAGDEATF